MARALTPAGCTCSSYVDRSHALRGNASRDALRHLPEAERGASLATFPRRSVGTIKIKDRRLRQLLQNRDARSPYSNPHLCASRRNGIEHHVHRAVVIAGLVFVGGFDGGDFQRHLASGPGLDS